MQRLTIALLCLSLTVFSILDQFGVATVRPGVRIVHRVEWYLATDPDVYTNRNMVEAEPARSTMFALTNPGTRFSYSVVYLGDEMEILHADRMIDLYQQCQVTEWRTRFTGRLIRKTIEPEVILKYREQPDLMPAPEIWIPKPGKAPARMPVPRRSKPWGEVA